MLLGSAAAHLLNTGGGGGGVPTITVTSMNHTAVWQGVVSNGTNYVAWADDDSVLHNAVNYVEYTSDGITWNSASLPAAGAWKDMAYGAGLYVMVGNSTSNLSTNVYMTSPDGINWTQRTFPVTTRFGSIVYNGTIFAISSNAGCYTSSNGTTWTHVSSFSPQATNGTLFLSQTSSTTMVTSPDCVTLTTSSLTNPAPNWPGRTVGRSSGFLVLGQQVTDLTKNNQFTSATGTSWVGQINPINYYTYTNIGSNNVLFVFTESYNATNKNLYYSTNGTTWFSTPLPTTSSVDATDFWFTAKGPTYTTSANRFVGVGYLGIGGSATSNAILVVF